MEKFQEEFLVLGKKQNDAVDKKNIKQSILFGVIICFLLLIQSYIQSFVIYLIQAIIDNNNFAKDLQQLGVRQFYDLIIIQKLHHSRVWFTIGAVFLSLFFLVLVVLIMKRINERKKVNQTLTIFIPTYLWFIFCIVLTIFNKNVYKSLDESLITNPLIFKHSKVEFLICDTPISDLPADSTKIYFEKYKKSLYEEFNKNDTLRKLAILTYDTSFCDSVYENKSKGDNNFTVSVKTSILRFQNNFGPPADSLMFLQKIMTNNVLIITYLALEGRHENNYDSIPIDFFPQLCVADLAIIPNLTWGLAQLTLNNFEAANRSIDKLSNSNKMFIHASSLPRYVRDKFTCSNAETYYLKAITEYAQSLLSNKSLQVRTSLLKSCKESLDSALTQIHSLKENINKYHTYYTLNNFERRNYLEYKYLCFKLNVLIEIFQSTKYGSKGIYLNDPCSFLGNPSSDLELCDMVKEIKMMYYEHSKIIPADKPTFKIHPIYIEDGYLKFY